MYIYCPPNHTSSLPCAPWHTLAQAPQRTQTHTPKQPVLAMRHWHVPVGSSETYRSRISGSWASSSPSLPLILPTTRMGSVACVRAAAARLSHDSAATCPVTTMNMRTSACITIMMCKADATQQARQYTRHTAQAPFPSVHNAMNTQHLLHGVGSVQVCGAGGCGSGAVKGRARCCGA
jgi:hypothetical protein